MLSTNCSTKFFLYTTPTTSVIFLWGEGVSPPHTFHGIFGAPVEKVWWYVENYTESNGPHDLEDPIKNAPIQK